MLMYQWKLVLLNEVDQVFPSVESVQSECAVTKQRFLMEDDGSVNEADELSLAVESLQRACIETEQMFLMRIRQRV